MKKIVLIVLLFLSLIFLLKFNKTDKKIEATDNKNISIIIEKENGNIKSKTFPEKENYYYDRTICNSESSTNYKATFNEENWKLNIKINSKTKLVGNYYCMVYFKEKPIINFEYTGNYQTFTVPLSGKYKIELWGSQGGGNEGKGAYTSGNISLSKGEKLYLYVGEKGKDGNIADKGGYNGGGDSTFSLNNGSGPTGGGSTDVRLVNGAWNNPTSIRSRIMVAGAGGGSVDEANGGKGHAGGLSGYDGAWISEYSIYTGKGATQNSGGAAPIRHSCAITNGQPGGLGFGGKGGQNQNTSNVGGGSGGGSGYYGGSGASGLCNASFYAGGGSSYISGHTGCIAITSETNETSKTGCVEGIITNNCSVHYSGKIFTNTIMIDGAGYKWTNVKSVQEKMPKPNGEYYSLGLGHTSNGYARITFLDKN